ncbi:MAG TPA: YraN family protein [Humibacillus sp.]|nr:YraN family protein [Humibacillus sp.]
MDLTTPASVGVCASSGSSASSSTTRALGDYGERLAARYLAGEGLTILDRNWRCVRGELDIVARDAHELVVCEVKTRSGEGFGAPFEAVTWRKQRRLRQLAGLWRDDHPEQAAGPLRIDVVSILRLPGQRPQLQHLKGVC